MPSREEMQALGQQIIGAYDVRVKGLADMRAQVGAQLAGFDRAHQAMARDMRAELARDSSNRRSAVGAQLKGLDRAHQAMAQGMRAELVKDCGDRRAAVGAHLKGLARAHQAMAQGLRAELAKDCADRRSSVNGIRAELARDNSQRRASVGAMRRGVQREQEALRKEQAGGRAAWQKMAATMGARRGSASAVAMARPKAPPSPGPKAAPMGAAPSAPPAPGAEEAAEGSREFVTLRERVFKNLANHPDGTRLVELEEEMGVGRFQMSRVLRSLMDDKKVEKRDLMYFAV